MNCLNISLVDSGRVGARVGSKSGDPRVVEPSPLEASLLSAMAPLGVESLSDSLEVAKPSGRFF